MFWFIVILLILLLAFLIIKVVFAPLFSIAKISQNKVEAMKDYEILFDKVRIEELPNALNVLPRNFRPDDSNIGTGVTLLLAEDNQLETFEAFSNNDSSKEIDTLTNDDFDYNLAFKDSSVYQLSHGKIEHILHKFDEPAFEPFRYFAIINENYFLMSADLKTVEYAKPILWQVNKVTFDITKIAENTYYSFIRPPLIIRPKEFNGTIIVYYTGDISYGFGGDASRPEYSTIRAYDKENPLGKDLARMSFAAGTVVDVVVEETDFLIYTDPSLPSAAGKPRVPPRTWRLSINE